MVFFHNLKDIFEIARQRAVGNAEVPVQKHRENEVFRTNLFSFAFGERLSVFFLDCPKAMDNINFPCGVESNQNVGNFKSLIFPVSSK